MDNALVRQAIAQLAKNALARSRVNGLASEASYGGKYTPAGLELADKNATLNALDRIKSKQMFGLGGSVI
jgi:hypothetical protein